MPIRAASRQASSNSARATLGLSAVTATARSPSAMRAALATSVLSIPPLKATATPPAHDRSTVRRRSALVEMSDGAEDIRKTGGAGGIHAVYRRHHTAANSRPGVRNCISFRNRHPFATNPQLCNESATKVQRIWLEWQTGGLFPLR